MSLDEIFSCTPWELSMAVEGWNEQQAGPTVEAPTREEFEAMRDR